MRIAAAAVVCAAVAAAVVWLALGSSPRSPSAPDPGVRTATARVRRGNVTQRVEVAGTLRYGGRRDVLNQLPPGILTAVARAGATLQRGDRLFAVSGTPSLLL